MVSRRDARCATYHFRGGSGDAREDTENDFTTNRARSIPQAYRRHHDWQHTFAIIRETCFVRGPGAIMSCIRREHRCRVEVLPFGGERASTGGWSGTTLPGATVTRNPPFP